MLNNQKILHVMVRLNDFLVIYANYIYFPTRMVILIFFSLQAVIEYKYSNYIKIGKNPFVTLSATNSQIKETNE